MIKSFLTSWLVIITLSIFSLGAPVETFRQEAKEKKAPPDAPLLRAEDKAQLTEALRLQMTLGDKVWPGLSQTRIPIILYNDRYEFLVGESHPPGPWAVVEKDDFNGRPYYRRLADKPQAFAVFVGSSWAGSLSTLDRINRKSPLKLSRDLHVVLILHEMFHALIFSETA